MSSYRDFLEAKSQLSGNHGFEPTFIPGFLFDFQSHLVEWATRKGRAAIFADCGLGKTPMQLVWAENVARHSGKPVLIITPLAVSQQTIGEAHKFGIECTRSRDGLAHYPITITNYERLPMFNSEDFGGVVCDESSILKSFDGVRRQQITEFMRKTPLRLLATATAAPNDYTELGTSSEALGYLGHVDMLGRFFKNDQNNVATKRMYGEAPKWRFKGHAELPFWRWVTSWSRACRKPSDLGFEDRGFSLPRLIEETHLVDVEDAPSGMLFNLPASNLFEQRAERKRTIEDRCRAAAELARHSDPVVIWCHLNDEGDILEEMIPDAIQVSGSDDDDAKEAKFEAFSSGTARVMVIKPRIGAWGLNWQHCSRVVYFPSHSYEAYYQAVRRCWRFGQKRDVRVDIVMTEGERRIMENLSQKSVKADAMFQNLVAEMNNAISLTADEDFRQKEEMPAWL